ncbi:hypothetical protein V6N12_041078 [Hibiscus sabdariffa]|uniref:Uncharacterized protein n=1 Tax=Hibiscus sabdariffa TaxID=183260 RepID=A0ABR2E5P2_9ROSI
MGTKERERERERDRDLELLIPVSSISEDGASKSSTPPDTPTASHGREVLFFLILAFLRDIYACAMIRDEYLFHCESVILLPLAITFYVTWGLIHLVDGFFSPVFDHLGINIFGVFMSSWLGASVLTLGELFIKKMPFVSYIYSASKQISSAISPDQNSKAFKEVAIIRHPARGQYMFGFITSTVVLQKGIEIVISGGMSVPKLFTTVDESGISSTRTINFEGSIREWNNHNQL